jgi:hypothetical protein
VLCASNSYLSLEATVDCDMNKSKFYFLTTGGESR